MMLLKKKRAQDGLREADVTYENTVEIQNVIKRYNMEGGNTCLALDRVSLTVPRGEFLAIVETSGSGKSTLLHVLGGVEEPTSGSVKVCGRELYEMNDNALSALRSLPLPTVLRQRTGKIQKTIFFFPTVRIHVTIQVIFLLEEYLWSSGRNAPLRRKRRVNMQKPCWSGNGPAR